MSKVIHIKINSVKEFKDLIGKEIVHESWIEYSSTMKGYKLSDVDEDLNVLIFIEVDKRTQTRFYMKDHSGYIPWYYVITMDDELEAL